MKRRIVALLRIDHLSVRITVVLLFFFLEVGLVSFSQADVSQQHTGDVNLSGSQVMLIENQTYYQKGDINLRGNSKLILRNATLLIDQTYHEEFNIHLHNNARIEIVDATVRSTFDMSCVFLYDQSSISARDSTISEDIVLVDSPTLDLQHCELLGLTLSHPGMHGIPRWGPPKASLDDVTVHELTLGTNTYCKMSLSDLHKGNFQDWNFGRDDVMTGTVPFELSLRNTLLEYVDFSIGGEAEVKFEGCEFFQLELNEGSHVTLMGSVVHQVVLKMRNQSTNIADLATGYISNWSLGGRDGRLPMELSIEDSTVVEGWYLRLQAGSYEIFDSSIVRLRDEFDDPSSRYVLHNCCIKEWMPWWDHGTVIFDNCIIGKIHTPDGATPTVKGSFCVVQESSLEGMFGPWRNDSTITRHFPVQVLDSSAQPLAGVTVELFGPEDSLMDTQVTNQSGEVEVRIAFDESNYNRTWTLRVPEFELSRRISLTSDTPITFPEMDVCPELGCMDSRLRLEKPLMAVPLLLQGTASWISWADEMLLSSDSEHVASEPSRDITALYAFDDGETLFVRLDFRGSDLDETGRVSRYEIYICSPEWGSVGYVIRPAANTLEKMEDWDPIETYSVQCRISDVVEAAIPLSLLPAFAELEIVGQSRIFPDKVVDRIISSYMQK